MTSSSTSRPYRKVKRAGQEADTRLRITEAAVELHRTLGPANTKVTEVAKRAGVSRMTVYSHFPTDRDLFMACSTHWASQNPFPDPSRWAGIEDISERLSFGLDELYRWYGLKEDMMGKVFRDTPILPSLGAVMGVLWSPYETELVSVLLHGWSIPRDEMEALEAGVRVALSFDTWRVLVESGLDDRGASAVAARMVIGAFRS